MSSPRGASGWLWPDWPDGGVGAVMTTRQDGASPPPFEGFNLGAAVGDEPIAVALNRVGFAKAIEAIPVYLDQVHGARVVRLRRDDAEANSRRPIADASVTDEPGVACTVLVADCLPVLFAAPHGRAVGAAHAGWRGLAAGVLEATLHEVCALAGCAPGEVRAWLGACIGPTAFQVGADVREAFDAAGEGRASRRFVVEREGKWLADLPGLAHDRLQAAEVVMIDGGTWCTVSDPSRFFSYRRDGVTGRMAAAVWIDRRC